jgi:AAHS family 4-hydroxybenzoate transporter-like MFS transporter
MEIASSRVNTVKSLSTIGWICFPIALFDGYDTLVMSFLAPLISKELGLAPGMFRGVFTATYAGAACGAVILGPVADRFGRKSVLLLALALAGAFTAATAWVHSLQGLMWCRAFAGVGLGGAIPIISALAASEVPLEQRRVAVTRVFIGYPVGAIVGGLLTAWLMGSVGWRNLMLGTGGVALALLALTAGYLKERNSQPSLSVADARPLRGLFGPKLTYVTITLGAAAFLILGVSYFLVSWIPTVLTLEGLSVPAASGIAVLLNVGGLAGAWSLSKVGRRTPARPIGASLCLGALLIAVFGFSLHGTAYIVAVIVFCIGFLVIGAQTNIPALTAWIYPLRSSASGVGLAMACGRIGSIAGPFIGGYLLASHMPWEALFQVAAVPTLLAGVALLRLSVSDNGYQ